MVLLSLATVFVAGLVTKRDNSNSSSKILFENSSGAKSENMNSTKNKDNKFRVIPFERLVVNVKGENGRRIFMLNYELRVQILDELFVKELESKKLILRDGIISIISNSEYSELTDQAGRLAIKKEIIGLFNNTIKSGVADDVYFTQFETN